MDVNDIIDNPQPSEEELQEFKTFVSDWFKYDDQIRKLVTATKERRRYQKALNVKIQDFMFRYKYNDLNTQHGRIKAQMKEVNAPLSVIDIKDKIAQYKDLSGENLIKQIFQDDRKTITKKSLTRVMPKVSLSLDI